MRNPPVDKKHMYMKSGQGDVCAAICICVLECVEVPSTHCKLTNAARSMLVCESSMERVHARNNTGSCKTLPARLIEDGHHLGCVIIPPAHQYVPRRSPKSRNPASQGFVFTVDLFAG